MIERIFSSLPSFKALDFHPGLNVILARKSPKSGDEQTRNAAGKSTILEIVHFLLGGSVRKGNIFLHSEITEELFGMVFSCGGSRIAVERRATPKRDRSKFFISDPIPPDLAVLVKSRTPEGGNVSLGDWKAYLGKKFFNLTESERSFTPKMRSLFSYFCRRDSAGGFSEAKRFFDKQKTWEQNVALAYLLGLNADILTRMQDLRVREEALDQLKKELERNQAVAEVVGNSVTLQSRLAIQKRRVEDLEGRIARFEVLPEYERFEREASSLRAASSELRDANTLDLQSIEELQAALRDEQTPGEANVERLYEAAGIQLPDLAKKTLQEVREFHRVVLANRRSYLGQEVDAARARIESRTTAAQQNEKREKELMSILAGKGALAHYNELQKEALRLRAEVEDLSRRLTMLQRIESGSADLRVERAELYRELVNDHRERADFVNEAVLLFYELSDALSERSSILKIEPTENGLNISVEGGPDAKSRGVKEQQIFCFDMMLMILLRRRHPEGLDFLFHDSHLFDAMDERQIAKAFELGARLSKEHGFQYIVTLNDDRIPTASFTKDFDFKSFVVPQELSDETETGGILGLRLRPMDIPANVDLSEFEPEEDAPE